MDMCANQKAHYYYQLRQNQTDTQPVSNCRGAHEPGATAVTDWLGIALSTDWLSTDDLGQDVGERAQK